MWLLFCWRSPTQEAGTLVSSVEAVDEINKRSRHISTIVAQLESQIRKEEIETKKHAKNRDAERARLGIQRLKMLGDKRSRLLNCTQQLWAMRETLKEQAVYVDLTEVFATTNTTLEQLLKKVDMDKITQMMDTFEEHAHQSREVGQALSFAPSSYTLEEEVEAELQRMREPQEEQVPEKRPEKEPQKGPQKEKRAKMAVAAQ